MVRIGVDLGGTNVAVGIVDDALRIIKKGSVPTRAQEPDGIADDIAALASRLLKEAGISCSDVSSLGVATPGVVDRPNGVIICASNLAFTRYPMAQKLKERLPIDKIFLENDANAAALGEAMAGAAKGTQNSVMVTLGTGVGGGIIIGGDVYMGFNCAAGELGHIVIEKDGVPCPCGRRGCWEVYSSATGLVRMTKEEMENSPDSLMHGIAKQYGKVNGRTAFEGAKQGDAAAKRVLDKYFSYLACGIGNVINVFQPERVVIGGGISNEKDNLLRPLIPLVKADSYCKADFPAPTVCVAELGNDAGIIGAACLK